MKSIRLQSPSYPPGLFIAESPMPTPAEGELLIKVNAAGVISTELEWYPSLNTRDGNKRIGAIPSHEFAGEIAAIGSRVTEFSIGEQVYGMNDWFGDGALAEYCLSRPAWIAPKPLMLSPAQAAAVPISALTAWQALYDRAKVSAGEKVLIHGGAGAVGTFAIQLAHLRGARVVTTVSSHNTEFVKGLGADETVDYKAVPFETQVANVDVVLDTIGGETLERSWGVLKPNGRMVTIATASESTTDERVKRAFLLVEPRRAELQRISKLIDSRDLQVVVDTVIPISQAADAYAGLLHRTGRGKTVVTIT